MEELTGFKFARVPASGGWQKERITGDVACIDNEDFEWSTECKNEEGFDLGQLLRPVNDRGKTKIIHWWKQCTDDAKKRNKKPMLLFTKNHYPIYCMCFEHDILSSKWVAPDHWFFYNYKLIFIFEDFIEINKK